jgi:hypothetical protein
MSTATNNPNSLSVIVELTCPILLIPYDDSRRVWYVDDPHIERELVKTHDSAVGFYALNGESLVEFTEDENKERICGV